MFGGIESGPSGIGPAGEQFSPRERLKWIFVGAVVTAAVSATFYVGAQFMLGNANIRLGSTQASGAPANLPASIPGSSVTAPPNQAASPANDTAATPEPTPVPVAITGANDLSGKVPRKMPGVLVGSGATITSILETGGVYCEYYAIHLALGQTLDVTVIEREFYMWTYAALPGKGYERSDWTNVNGPLLAGEEGTYSIKTCDSTAGAGTYYKYEIDFSVH
jgi:hypothetical protein